jgi:hypothetical protein
MACNSISAPMLTWAEPADMAAQAAASHIQAGTSREMPARASR